MKVIQSPKFKKVVKKLLKNEKKLLDDQIRTIINNPEVGDEKRGDLACIRVYKFKLEKKLYLLSYLYSNDEIQLLTLGPHENYYKDLKNYLK